MTVRVFQEISTGALRALGVPQYRARSARRQIRRLLELRDLLTRANLNSAAAELDTAIGGSVQRLCDAERR